MSIPNMGQYGNVIESRDHEYACNGIIKLTLFSVDS